jgi:penicillin G amidase
MSPYTRRRSGHMRRRILAAVIGVPAVLILGAAGYGTWVLHASTPILDGTQRLAGLSAPVELVRDAGGVPTLTASTRLDLARGLGFVHAQERFFQMDLLRRAGAGELSALVGPVALTVDRARRMHRFRARAALVLAAMSADERALIAAYTDGVNAGLQALSHAPWEYTLLRVDPSPWVPGDTLLVVYAMYFDLQDSVPDGQLQGEAAIAALGPSMAAFLYPRGVPEDAALDGSQLAEPAIPAAMAASVVAPGVTPPPPAPGSNNFAVAGKLSATGSAIVENDMHLALIVPNIWFRAHMVVPGSLDLIGVTLPGEPFQVVGSNRHVAWAFTDGYIETGDAVVIETLPGDATSYKTPDGPRKIQVAHESLCVAHGGCEDLAVPETIWGPVLGHDVAGHPVVWRWMAHDPNAVGLAGFVALEKAGTVRQALDAAHSAGLPDQNFTVGDKDGHIAWTVIGQVPRRVGLDDQLPHSWADGSHGWNGYLAARDVPEIIDPPDGRLWTANARTLGGAGLATLGNGGYAGPYRARALRDDLFARDRFAETDMLAVATETRNHFLDPWQKLLLQAVAAKSGDARIEALRPLVENWGGSAVPDSAGYRLVREYRGAVIRRIYAGLGGKLGAQLGSHVPIAHNADRPCLRLLAAQPAALVPPPFKSWDDVLQSAIGDLLADIGQYGDGKAADYTWGLRNHVAIQHPLAMAIPGLHYLTDPPDVAVAGDDMVPRVAIQGFGASERMIVSPGHEERAIFEMPVGQSDNPLSPYYGVGEDAWVKGSVEPFLPGEAKWRLRLVPAA